MKRQGTSAGGQPPVKKPDASTDLRSKIGAKLQTLLNGLDTDAVLYAKRRKQLYEDLFGKPKYSEIIIDPTIVIKEEPDVQECSSDSSTLLNSQNFLLSAKSRLTELLNKQDGANKYKDSGKENALFSNRNKSSSSKSFFLQNASCSKSPSILYNSLNKKRNSSNKEHDSTNDQDATKNLVVVLEDCMKSNYRTRSSCNKHPDNNITSSNVGSKFVRKQGKHLTLDLDNLANKKASNGGLCSTRKSKSCVHPDTSVSECSFIEDDSEICRSKSVSAGSVLSSDASPLKVMGDVGVFPNSEGSISDIPYYNEDDSEMIDDPIIPQVIVDIKVGEVNFETENSDSEVELLCEKERTAEVITLEDNDDDVVIEGIEVSGHKKGNAAARGGFVHKCKQCGKSFRAESLLNFHLKMHGKLSQPSSSSSYSFS